MSPVTVDARGLLCPMPVIRTQNAVRKLMPGQQIEIMATDPGALNDIPAWARVHGHRVLQATETEAGVKVVIEVCAPK